jgi:hypothetical protein
MSEEEIQSALTDQLVSRACRLIGKRDNKHYPPLAVLTFEVPSSPAPVCVMYESGVHVRPYIFNAMMFYRCRQCGHTQQMCAYRSLSVGTAVRVHTVKGHVPTHPPVWTLEYTYRATERALSSCSKIQERWVRDGLSFPGVWMLDVRQIFMPHHRPELYCTEAIHQYRPQQKSAPRLKTYKHHRAMFEYTGVNSIRKSPVKNPSRCGTRGELCDTMTVAYLIESPSDTCDWQTVHIGTARGKHRETSDQLLNRRRLFL